MRFPGVIYVTLALLPDLAESQPLAQVVNVAALPGRSRGVLCDAGIHWGYGFPIGGVAATAWQACRSPPRSAGGLTGRAEACCVRLRHEVGPPGEAGVASQRALLRLWPRSVLAFGFERRL